MNLLVRAPRRREAELRWVCGVAFERWLGLSPQFEWHDLPLVQVAWGGASLAWPDVFLARADAQWRSPATLPRDLQAAWALPDEALVRRVGHASVPMWFGDGRFEREAGRVRLPIDITGSLFFMLSRYEETVADAPRDAHGRFPGRASVAARSGLIHRALVDEWMAVLVHMLRPMLPEGALVAPRQPPLWVTCDVDMPYAPAASSLRRGLRQAASDIVHERRWADAAGTFAAGLSRRIGLNLADPVDRFDSMMQACEARGQRMTFFFIARREAGARDGAYALDEPPVASLLQRIVQRGHDVALHGSYHSVEDEAMLSLELHDLDRAVTRAGGRPVRGMRQHYLRWSAADTPAAPVRPPAPRSTARALAAQGLAWDSTLGHADAPGFRCGTSHPFPLFDLDRRVPLPVVERPLVLMEASLLSRHYGGMKPGPAALERAVALRQTCIRHGGTFTLLWHNDHLRSPAERALFESLIDGAPPPDAAPAEEWPATQPPA